MPLDLPQAPARAHEPDRPDARMLIWFGIGLFTSLGIVLFLVGLSFRWFSEKLARSEPPPAPLIGSQTPPAPRLQVNPELDLQRMRAEEDQHLDTYRWVDRQAGTIAMPINRAIEYAAQHGLPVFPGAPAEARKGRAKQ